MPKTFKPLCCHPNKQSLRTVNIFLGFFFILNYCLGTGYLGIPYAFLYSGFIAAVPTIIVIMLVSWLNANYLLEVMARAQALEYLDASSKSSQSQSDSSTDSEADIKDILHPSSSSYLQSTPASEHPKFELSIHRKFEISELCTIFFNKYVSYLYMSMLSVYGFLNNWAFATVAGSAWATNIPFRNFGAIRMCEEDSFFHRTLPEAEGGCLFAYYFCLLLFAMIVVPLCLFDLHVQAFMQVILGFIRFVTMSSIIIYCIVRLSMDGDACQEQLQIENITSPINIDIASLVLKFDAVGWLVAIPVITNAFTFQTGISSLTFPVNQKRYHHWLLASVFIAAMVCYLSLGIMVPLWFRAATQETVTLSWAVFAHRSSNLVLRIYSYYLILFPSVDVISAYPLINHVISNNLYSLIMGQDTSKKPKYQCDCFLRLAIRLIVALLPIFAAFGVSNLVTVLKFAGLFGFMNFCYPAALQLRSIFVCKKEFGSMHSSPSSDSIANEGVSKGSQQASGSEAKHEVKEKSGQEAQEVKSKSDLGGARKSLLKRKKAKDERKQSSNNLALYMTPYSYGFVSRPGFVGVAAVLGLFLFVLAFASLFLRPVEHTCTMLLESYYLQLV